MSGCLDGDEAFDKLLDRLVSEVARSRDLEEAKNAAEHQARQKDVEIARLNGKLADALGDARTAAKIGEDLSKAFNAWFALDVTLNRVTDVPQLEALKAAAAQANKHFDEIPF